MKARVLIACPHLQRDLHRFLPIFESRDIELVAPPVAQQLDVRYLLDNIHQFDGVVAGDDPFPRDVLERATRLRVIAKWGIGLDNIDRAAAEEFGIRVLNTPGQLSEEVADNVIGYMVMLARQLHKIDHAVRTGQWTQPRGVSLSHKTLGVIGYGGIGRQVARRAVAMSMNVLVFDPFLDLSITPTESVVPCDLEALLRESDFVSLNCSLTDANHHIIDDAQFAQMKRGAYLINTSRGALINEEALVRAMRAGIIAGAALDVFEVEPLPQTSPLLDFDNCILGSHNSSNTHDAVERVNTLVVENLLSVLDEALLWAA